MASKRRRVIQSEGRSMIASVYHFLREEYEFTKSFREPNCDLSHLRDITRRAAEATGVSIKTVQRILKEEKGLPSSSSKFPSPMKKRRKRDNKIEIDNFTADVVRSTIQNFHGIHKEIPTLAKLRTVLNEKIGFEGCIETVRQLLLKLGYKWRKTENNRKVLTERHDIQMWRLKFLKKMSEYRSEGRPIVYTHEPYVLSTTGTRFILVHAGTKDGFIKNASLIYKANSTAGDYDSNMSYDDYVKWLNEKLLPNLAPRSVIVLDNASFYHNTRADKLPTSATNKADMQQWLRDKGIAFEQSLLKLELYDIIKKHKDQHKTYEIDDFVKSKGFDVIRLPPCHPELNAIENIWGIVKIYIASKNNEQNMTNTERLINESLDRVSSETWQNTCAHVEKIEKEYLKYMDMDLEFIINLQNDSDDSDSESELESDSD